MLKRFFDIVGSSLGILLFAPLFLVMSLMIKLDSNGPIFFRQERIGMHGRKFRIHKFRTMSASSSKNLPLQITVGEDPRITRVGRLLRKYKLDELAQLIDVFLGHMSLVGPRPEVLDYVKYYPSEERLIIQSVRPGITDWASIKFKDESQILSEAADPEAVYVNSIIPIKVKYYVSYVKNQTFFGDLKIIFSTLVALLR